jgi:hypothetical protein
VVNRFRGTGNCHIADRCCTIGRSLDQNQIALDYLGGARNTPFRNLRRRIVRRLDEGDRGDRGWFLITRVHLSTARLKAVAEYLHDLGAADSVALGARHYAELALLCGVAGHDPGITLRRHHLLAMETPLNLLRRTDGNSWREVSLTQLGVALALEEDSNRVLEEALSRIVFCREPYYTETREQEYQDFDVRPYRAAIRVLQACEGWIDRDEYDLFLSRIRQRAETNWAIQGIREFRTLRDDEKLALLDEVRIRVPGAKRYSNWRDMGLHTFSLFSLGLSAARTEQVLRLTRTLVAERAELAPPGRIVARPRRELVLQIPQPPENQDLTVPPSGREVNAGTEGELLVAKLLKSDGWRVVFYTNRRGFGFDLWAKKNESVMVIEVKSSFARMGAITLTRLEFEAAAQYRENYYIAVVEDLNLLPTVRFIQNPRMLAFNEQMNREYLLRREVWHPAALRREA